ncbi:MAG: LysR family transcriptional regulator [Verrucomicrobia bacterium]|nr:LysR family transcriptional regulator [Verrucomicrobiota bacterium]
MKTDRRFFKALRFRQLRALVELSHQKTFSAVASALGLSVVSAWRQVRSLEEEFGVQLVAEGQQLSLTDDGRALVELAEPLVESFLSLRSMFDDRKGKAPRKLAVAAPAGVLSDAVPGPVTRYRRNFPNVGLRLMDRPSRGACAALLAGQADIAIVGMTVADELPTSLTMRPLTRYPIHLLCPADHVLATMKRLTVRAIAQHPLVLSSEDTSDRSQVDLTFARAGLLNRINVTISATRLPLITRYVALGFGVALLAPGMAKAPKPRRGQPVLVWRDVSHLFGHEDLVLLQRKGRFELPHVKAFRELVEAAYRAEPKAASLHARPQNDSPTGGPEPSP